MGNDVSTTVAQKTAEGPNGSKRKEGHGGGHGSKSKSGKHGGSATNKARQQEQQQQEGTATGATTIPQQQQEAAAAAAAAPDVHYPSPVTMEPSAGTFGAANPSKSRPSRNANPNPDQIITDGLSDVRLKYHINPREIGHGHYGVVRKCMDRQSREWYAIKSIRKSKVGKIDVLKREISILKEVNHPNIIRLIEVHEDQKYLHLVTELCTGGELFDRIIAKTQSEEGHFSESDAAHIIRCILDAIAYCHEVKQIVHRDLKPENFLFKTEAEDAEIKIIDFGLSRHDTQNFGVMKTKVGTPYYVAPEVLNREYTKSCDIWSIGVITYILLCGYPPFYGDSDNQIFDSVRTGRFDFPAPDWDSISNAAKDFICCLLRKDPSKRLTASQAMKHRWIKEQTEGSNKRNSTQVCHQSGRCVTFKNFISMQKLKKAALGHIATHLTQTEVSELGDIFHKIDSDNNGIITLQEFDDAFATRNFPPDLKAELKRLREDLSLSGEDMINYRDFVAAMMDKSLVVQEDKIRMAFEHFKKTDNNCLLVSDLVDLFGGEAQAKEILGEIDTVGDGKISYQEFHQMMAGSSVEN